jgi:hypothetical protein
MHVMANREVQAGRMLGGGQLLPLDRGARVTVDDGKITCWTARWSRPRR